jgi:hypothetical protein
MRLFKKIRGAGIFTSMFGGGGWHTKDCVVNDESVEWTKLVEGKHVKHKDEGSMRTQNLKGAHVAELKEEELPAEVAKFLGSSDFKFYVVLISSPEIPGHPLEFGYVDEGMMTAFRENVQMAINKANGV